MDQLWKEELALFGGHAQNEEFPLLVKILDAKENLSIQVHPTDDYARAHGEKFGKAESWYILPAAPGAKIYYGHTAKTKQGLQMAVDNGQINTIFKDNSPLKPMISFIIQRVFCMPLAVALSHLKPNKILI